MVIELRKEARSLLKEYGIKVSREKFISSVGRAWVDGNKSIIKIPPLTTIRHIYVAFHEIAHVIKDHHNENTKKEYLQEYEAERWALNKLREFGVDSFFPIDYKEIEQDAKRYVFSYMVQEKTQIPDRVKNWILKF